MCHNLGHSEIKEKWLIIELWEDLVRIDIVAADPLSGAKRKKRTGIRVEENLKLILSPKRTFSTAKVPVESRSSLL